LGIVVRMYYQEHEEAHFHGEPQGRQAAFTFDGRLLAGALRSRTALHLIEEWAALYREELEDDWSRVRAGQPLAHIAPLD